MKPIEKNSLNSSNSIASVFLYLSATVRHSHRIFHFLQSEMPSLKAN